MPRTAKGLIYFSYYYYHCFCKLHTLFIVSSAKNTDNDRLQMFSYFHRAMPIILKGSTCVSVLFKWHQHGIIVTPIDTGQPTTFCLL